MVREYVSNPEYVATTQIPRVDPWADVDAELQMTVRNRGHRSLPSSIRLARRATSTRVGTVSGGFRLVRTLPSE